MPLIIYATAKDGSKTRFVINCDRLIESIKNALHSKGYKTKVVEAEEPARSLEEKNRATRILGELFGN